jgi:8-oxo-dGTP pyrophosphatase MutT (NUDIX family)
VTSTGGVSLDALGGGIARISWSGELQDSGQEAASAAVREVLGRAFNEFHYDRVEALVDPDDLTATRIAAWAGLQREGVMRGVAPAGDGDVRADRVVFARIRTDAPVPGAGFRSVLNSFLPLKRAIAQMLVRDTEGRVLLCNPTGRQDWDLPGGVVKVSESPRLAAQRAVEEELALTLPAGPLVLTDWLPPWSGWEDAICLVFDGGCQDAGLAERIVPQRREISAVRFSTPQESHALCADFTARRVDAALVNAEAGRCTFAESGRAL